MSPDVRKNREVSYKRYVSCMKGEGLVGLMGTLMACAVLFTAPAFAQSKGSIRFDIVIAKVSSGDGGIDARGAKLHDKLKDQFRYEQLEVLTTRSLTLSIDEVGRVALKNGRELLVKPLVLDSAGALVAIDISGLLQTDIKMTNNHLVVIGAESFEGGKLVVSLEAHF